MLLAGLALGVSTLAAQDVTVTSRVAWNTPTSSPLAGVVVWLAPMDQQTTALHPTAQHPRLTQRNKSFEPHVLVIPVGSVVEFPNRDPFFHNVFSLFDGKRFDLGLYEAGSTREVHFDKAGVSYIFCNIHPQMSAVVIAVPAAYHATSDRQGQLIIPSVPAGAYALHIWYEGALPEDLEKLSRVVTISDRNSNLGVLRLSAPGSVSGHKNKYGRDYDPPSSAGYEPQ